MDGPRGVGKTTSALERAADSFELDDPQTLEIVSADPHRMVGLDQTVLIDEWQRLPESWDLVRRAVDRDMSPGRFILTGSASPLKGPTHSGAGRIVSLRMRPLSLFERWDTELFAYPTVSLAELLSGSKPAIEGATGARLDDYVEQIVAGGFPAMRLLPGRARRASIDGYIARIIETDFREVGRNVRNPQALRRWMGAYAAATSTTASYEKIRDAATAGHGDKPSRTATRPYIDVLERLWILDSVPAWSPTRNRLAKLASGPKHQLVDPALAVALLEVDREALLEGRPAGPPTPRDGTLLGALFESLIALNLRVYAQAAEARVGHLRKNGGTREVDFIVARTSDKVVAVEVKLSRTVSDRDVRHLHWLKNEIGDDLLDQVVVTTGSEAYRRADGIAVVPAALLGP